MGRRLLWVVLLAGCGGSRSAEQEFLAALPKQEQVEVAFPNGSVRGAKAGLRSDALVGQTAEFYAATRITSERLNALVGSVLDTLGRITQTPPTVIERNRAVWGPFTPVLSPVNYRLTIERAGQAQFVYHVDGRPKSDPSEEAFDAVLTGGASPERRTGTFAINLNRLHVLDPVGTRETGAIAFAFEISPQQGTIRIHLEQVGDATGTVSADYAYVQHGDGSGDFFFLAHPSLSGVAADLEGALVRSRWMPSGAGRADAHVSDTTVARDITECWDENFARVFFSARPRPSEGDPARCVYAEPPPSI